MRWPKLSKRYYKNDLDKRVFSYYRLIGWHNFQAHLGNRLYSLIIPAKRTDKIEELGNA